jgi:hypothetical protein
VISSGDKPGQAVPGCQQRLLRYRQNDWTVAVPAGNIEAMPYLHAADGTRLTPWYEQVSAALFPTARLIVQPGAGHFSWLDGPRQERSAWERLS